MEHFVEFEDVCKYYQTGSVKIAAADHLNFYVDKGEFCIIVGPSGAGKTTLLNILGGMDNCDEGNVWLDGRNVSRFSARELTTYRRYDVGFVFQFYNLVQNLTALENVELASSGCPLPAHWPKTPSCCSATSPPVRWITAPANRCWAFCRIPAARPDAPSLLLPTTRH